MGEISQAEFGPGASDVILRNASLAGRDLLYEYEVYELLRGSGISIPQYDFVKKDTIKTLSGATRRDRTEFFRNMIEGLPGDELVVKVVSDQVFHKNKAGGVKFITKNPRSVWRVASRMAKDFEDKGFQGVLVCEKVEYDHRLGEFLIGITHDPQFGPVVTFGAGGTAVEESKDVARCLVPDAEGDWGSFAGDLDSMIRRTKTGSRFSQDELSLLVGYIYGICRATSFSGDFVVTELDVNPLVINMEHNGFALDGVLKFKRKDSMPYFAARTKPARNMKKLFKPERVAVIGGSTAEKLASQIHESIGKDDCTVLDVSWVKNPDSGIPDNIDLALVASVDDKVPGVIRALVDKKKTESDKNLAVVIISGGFAEFDPSGSAQSGLESAVAYAGESGVALDIVGPNTIGVHSGYPALFIPREKMEVAQSQGSKKEALIFQSGGVLTSYIDFHPEANIGFVAGTGNAFDLCTADLVEGVLVNRPDIEIIRLYIEGFKDGEGRRLCELTEKAVGLGKEVRIYLAGTTEEGRKAAVSHTAALSPSIAIAKDALRAAGAVFERQLVDEPFDYETMLPRVGPMAEARTIAIIGNSGGQGVIAAEGLQSLKFLEPSEETLAELERLRSVKLLPKIFRPGHPFDITGAGTDEHLARVAETVLEREEDSIDALVIAYTPEAPTLKGVRGESDMPSGCALPKIIDIAKAKGIPIVVSLTGREENWLGIVNWLNANGVAYTQNAAQAVRLLEIKADHDRAEEAIPESLIRIAKALWIGIGIGSIIAIAASASVMVPYIIEFAQWLWHFLVAVIGPSAGAGLFLVHGG
ncbi:MAG TPA: acetate--CoA ligase family protein, partial [Candidatus Omnitrophota bacterium]|nr:acetate--CoA ligase family protein [Candidatus Omnitrophota bacterium]